MESKNSWTLLCRVLYVSMFIILSLIVLASPIACSKSRGNIGYWRFNEGSGVIATDSSSHKNNGEAHNATWASGAKGSALCFNGTDDSYVEVPNKAELTPTTRLTIDVWIKPASYPQEYIAILYKGDLQQTECFGERSYSLWASARGEIHFTWTPAGEECQIACQTEGGLIPTGEWSHVRVDLNTEKEMVRIFVNGRKVLEDDCPQKPMKVGDSPLRIGGMLRSEVNQSGFSGCIDEVRIY